MKRPLDDGSLKIARDADCLENKTASAFRHGDKCVPVFKDKADTFEGTRIILLLARLPPREKRVADVRHHYGSHADAVSFQRGNHHTFRGLAFQKSFLYTAVRKATSCNFCLDNRSMSAE
jgi:hypothetical protein